MNLYLLISKNRIGKMIYWYEEFELTYRRGRSDDWASSSGWIISWEFALAAGPEWPDVLFRHKFLNNKQQLDYFKMLRKYQWRNVAERVSPCILHVICIWYICFYLLALLSISDLTKHLTNIWISKRDLRLSLV